MSSPHLYAGIRTLSSSSYKGETESPCDSQGVKLDFFFSMILAKNPYREESLKTMENSETLSKTKDTRVANQKQRTRHRERDGVGRAVAKD